MPRSLVIQVLKAELDPAYALFVAAVQVYPNKKKSELAVSLGLTLDDVAQFKDVIAELSSAPPVRQSSSGAEMPYELAKWLRAEITECFNDTGEQVYVPSKIACAEMWQELAQDPDPQERLTMVLTVLRDIHDNQMAVKSPSAFLKKIVMNDSREQLEQKMRAIEEFGTAIGKEKLLERARRLRDEELADAPAMTDPDYDEEDA